MNFCSVNFLFFFLPVLLAVYFSSGVRFLNKIKFLDGIGYRNLILIVFSFFFYFIGEKGFTFLLLFSAVFNFLISKNIEKAGAKNVLAAGIIVNLGILGVFKYLNFFIDQINLLGIFGEIPYSNVHLPVGISFFTFQAISYIVDVYKKDVKPAKFLDFTLYLSLFPQLVAGPIVRYKEIEAQIKERFINSESFAEGLRRFISGLAKKVIIADTLSYTVDKIFSSPAWELTSAIAVLGAVCYTFQIFFDFSGYSDMAIGLGRMFGFKFPENFNYPYISKSIKEFWKRWHITLSRWFKDYLYIPLGGSRKGQRRTYINILIVFLLTGLWHGASWNFIIWGVYNGVLIVLERAFLIKFFEKLPVWLSHIYFWGAILIGWIIFRSENLGYALFYIKTMFTGFGTGGIKEYLNYELAFTLIAAFILSVPVFKDFSKIPEWIKTGFYIILLIISGAYISANTYQPFIYFRF